MDLTGKTAIVMGTKRSGVAAIELLLAQGAHVVAMDADPAPLPGLAVRVLPQSAENLAAADLVVLSPGVPFDLPMLVQSRVRGVPVIGEVELASYFLRGPIIGITGSNGKTTTTALTAHLLHALGVPCQVGGNIGTAVTSLTNSSHDEQWNVLELSSFQLETIKDFHATVAACLNVTPDHLDRHGTFENYIAAKQRLFETQQAGSFAILNQDDPVCRAFAEKTKAEVHWFSSRQAVERGFCLQGGCLLLNGTPVLQRSDIALRGLHNLENVMAASLAAVLAGADPRGLPSAVRSFPGVEHRIEFVRSLGGVDYFNDSKATNVDASLKAVAAFDGRLWIILGGKHKGTSYAPLADALRNKAKVALLIGAEASYPAAAAPLMREAFSGVIPFLDCGTIKAAVEYAHAHAEPGDTVLLSPACASFDQFANYEERGKTFKEAVQTMS